MSSEVYHYFRAHFLGAGNISGRQPFEVLRTRCRLTSDLPHSLTRTEPSNTRLDMVLAQHAGLHSLSMKGLRKGLWKEGCHFPTAWEILFLADFLHQWWQDEYLIDTYDQPRLLPEVEHHVRPRLHQAHQRMMERHRLLAGMRGYPLWKPFCCLTPVGNKVIVIDPAESEASVVKVFDANQIKIRRVLILRPV